MLCVVYSIRYSNNIYLYVCWRYLEALRWEKRLVIRAGAGKMLDEESNIVGSRENKDALQGKLVHHQ